MSEENAPEAQEEESATPAAAEVGFFKVGALELGEMQDGVLENGAPQISAFQILSGEVTLRPDHVSRRRVVAFRVRRRRYRR